MVNKQTGLGRGLGALISTQESITEPASQTNVLLLPCSEIEANATQPRKNFAPEALHELAESIREQGVLQPILVRMTEDGRYQIIAGERRYRASQLAGLREIPCIVKNFDDEKTLAVALIENVQREDLDILEEATTYRRLTEEYGYTQADLGKIIGKSRVHIANTLRLLSLPHAVLLHLEGGRMSAGHARALLGLKKEKLICDAAAEILRSKLSVRETEALVQRMLRGDDKRQSVKLRKVEYNLDALAMKELSARLRETFTTKASVEKNKIVIEYYSEEELQRILEKMGVEYQL